MTASTDTPNAYASGDPAEPMDDSDRYCDHEWRFLEHSYEGDPNVPNGTRDFKVFRCEKCGEEENRA